MGSIEFHVPVKGVDATAPDELATLGQVGASGIPQGGPLTADLDADGFKITGLADGVAADDAATVGQLGGGGGGDFVVLFDLTLVTTATTFDITGISGAYAHLNLLGQLRTNQATTDDYALCRFNNDSGNNYDGNAFYTVNTTNSNSGAESGIGFWRIANVLGANATSGDFTVVDCDIPNYAGTTARKQAISRWMGRAAATRIIVGNSGGNWRNTAAITRITITAGGGSSFIAGSRVTLYGMSV